MRNGRLAGEKVLVTGAARGIGLAIAQCAAREGADVALLDVLADELESAAATLAGHGVEVCTAVADITSPAEVNRAVADVVAALGPVTVLVNNAGRNSYGDATTMSEQQWDDVFAVDLKGAWLLAKAVLPAMTAAGRGSIVNIGSLHATLTCTGMFPYAAAKSGLVGLTRSLALDVARHGVRVNVVSPGYIRTALVDEYFTQHPDPDAEVKAIEVQPLGRLGAPADVAEVVCFLASDAAAFVTGAEWGVDGGLGARFA